MEIERGILALGFADVEKRYLLGLMRALRHVGPDAPGAKVAEFFRHGQTLLEGAKGSTTSSPTLKSSSSSSPTNEELLEYLEGLFADVLDRERLGEARLASGFIEDAAGPNALPKLSRYEVALLRSRDQKLAMLKALQAASEDTK